MTNSKKKYLLLCLSASLALPISAALAQAPLDNGGIVPGTAVTTGSIAIGDGSTAGRDDMSNPQDPGDRTTVGKRDNIAIGVGATADGGRVISIGEDAGKGTTDNWNIQNVNIGTQAGANSKKDFSVAIGYQAGYIESDTAKQNQAAVADGNRSSSVFIGNDAGHNAASYGNIALGSRAGENITDTNAGHNILLGANAGQGLSSNDGKNIFFPGYGPGANIAIGQNAAQFLSDDDNIAIGGITGRNLKGDNNILMGHLAGDASSANASVIIGGYAGGTGMNNDHGVMLGNFANGGAPAVAKAYGLSTDTRNVISIGSSPVALGKESTAIGFNARAVADNTNAMGRMTKATALNATAIGTNAVASDEDTIAIGTDSIASHEHAISIGKAAAAQNSDSLAAGTSATANGSSSVAIGNGTLTSARNTVAIGNGSQAIGKSGVAIGDGATAGSESSNYLYGNIAIGTGASSAGGIAIGDNTKAADYSLAAGLYSEAGNRAAAVGYSNHATGGFSSSLGVGNQTTAISSTAVGNANVVSGASSAAVGVSNNVAQINTFVLGSNVTTTQHNSVVLGGASTDRAATNETKGTITLSDGTTREYSGFTGTSPVGVVSVGAQGRERQIINVAAGNISSTSTDAVNGSQLYSVANEVGKNADAITNIDTKIDNVATHYYSVNSSEQDAGSNYNNDGATGRNALAAGVNTSARGFESTAIGYGAKTTQDNAVAIGNGSQSIGKSGIAIGTGATAGSPDSNYIYGNIAIGTGAMSAGGVAIGDNAKAGSHSLAAGLRSEAGDRAAAVGYSDTASGQWSSALGVGNDATALSSTAVGNGNTVSGEGSAAVGVLNNVAQANTYVLGSNVTTTQAGSVVLGSDSTDRAATNETKGTITLSDGTTREYSGFAGTAPAGVVSVGAAGTERQVINVAAGNISSTSTDAVNGSQLYSVANEVGKNADAISNINTQITNVTTEAGKHTTVKAGDNKNLTVTEGTNTEGGKEYTVDLSDTFTIGGPGKDGKDGTDGHIGIDGKDGVSGVGIDGKDGISVKGDKGEVGINGNDGISIKGADGKDAVAINGKDGVGHIGLTGPAGTNGKDGTNAVDISVKNGYNGTNGVNGATGVDGKDGITRIVYEDKTGEHQVATLDDGMKYGGDTGDVIAKKLNNQVNVIGGITDQTKLTTTDNIGVVSDGTDNLKVRLAKDLTGITSISNGSNTTITLGDKVVNMNGSRITNVATGTAATDAVNLAQLNQVVNDSVSASATHYYSVRSSKQGAGSNYNNDGAKGHDSLAAGVNAYAYGEQSIAIGLDAKTTQTNATAIGHGSQAIGKSGIAIGDGATAGSPDSNYLFGNIAIGTGATSAGGVAIGDNSKAGNFSLAAGLYSEAGDRAAAVGYSNKATGQWSSALGVGNEASALSSTAVGNGNHVTAQNSAAVGVRNKVEQENTFVLGSGVTTTQAGSVVLGSASTDRAATSETKGTITLSDGTTREYSGFAGTSPAGVVSVGAQGSERQIINVAAGKISADSTDAVNGSQLYSVANEVGKNADAIKNINTQITNVSEEAGKHTTVKAGNNQNLTVTEGTNAEGGKEYTVDLSENLNIGGPGKDGKDGVDGHIGVDGKDGKSGVGIDGKDGISVKGDKGEVGINGNDGISIKGADGKDAVAINGKDGVGHIGLTGPAGTNGKDGTNAVDISVKNGYNGTNGVNGATGVDGKDGITRIVYEDKTGEHQVATLDDGMKYGGDTGDVIAKKLNNQVNVIGGITDQTKLTTTDNIGVVSDGKDNLKVRLAKDLTGITSISNGTNTTVTLGDNVVNVNGSKITNVQNGTIAKDSKDAVNGGQLYDLSTKVNQNSDAITNLNTQITNVAAEAGKHTTVKAGNNKNLTVTEGTNADGGKEYTVDLSESLNIGGPGKDGKDGVDGHIGVDGKDGKSGVGIDGKDGISVKGDKGEVGINGNDGISVKGDKGEVGINGNDGISIKGADGKDAVAINGKDGVGHIGLTGPAGTNGKDGTNAVDISVKNGYNGTNGVNGATGVDGKDGITRIVYEDKTGEHQVATLDDGMKYGGDTGKVIAKKLNNQVNVIGGIKDESKLTASDNIGVVSDGSDNLKVRLAKDLTGITSISNGSNTTVTFGDEVVNVNGSKITNVKNGDISEGSQDAVNGGQVYTVTKNLDEKINNSVGQLGTSINRLDSRVNRVGAGAAALAALHPLDFDPDDKWDFAAGYGNYKDAHAVSVGAFYRPNEDTMFSIGGSFGGGENMVNAGVSFKLGQSNHVTTSRVAMAKEILDLKAENKALKSRLDAMDQRMNAFINGFNPDQTKNFPDVPENHWAYKYVATLAGNGYLEGYPDGDFHGDRTMTRYEWAALFYRALQHGAPMDQPMQKAVKEFGPEMQVISGGRFRVDRISGEDNDRYKVDRVRVNNENKKDQQDQRDIYGTQINK